MANITQTAANVGIGLGTVPTKLVQFGGTVTQGQPVYRGSTGKYLPADANDGVEKSVVTGIALTPGVLDSFGIMALPSTSPGASLVNLGATLAVGQTYAVSATVGAIAPIADLTTGQFITILGVAVSASLLDFQTIISSTAKA